MGRGVDSSTGCGARREVVVDAPHKDLRRARSALNSLIPTSTGSATAITMIYPELTGKLDGVAVRVPLLNASLTDGVFTMTRDVTADEVNGLLREAADGALRLPALAPSDGSSPAASVTIGVCDDSVDFDAALGSRLVPGWTPTNALPSRTKASPRSCSTAPSTTASQPDRRA